MTQKEYQSSLNILRKYGFVCSKQLSNNHYTTWLHPNFRISYSHINGSERINSVNLYYGNETCSMVLYSGHFEAKLNLVEFERIMLAYMSSKIDMSSLAFNVGLFEEFYNEQ